MFPVEHLTQGLRGLVFRVVAPVFPVAEHFLKVCLQFRVVAQMFPVAEHFLKVCLQFLVVALMSLVVIPVELHRRCLFLKGTSTISLLVMSLG